MRYEWSEWFLHDGQGCPVIGEYVQDEIVFPYGATDSTVGIVYERDMEGWLWENFGYCPLTGEAIAKVIRYRVRRPLVSEWLAETTSDLPVTEDA
jgi:hypothetical protein